jgi:hypothetical protein
VAARWRLAHGEARTVPGEARTEGARNARRGRGTRGGREVAAAPWRGAREEAITENRSTARTFRWIDLNIDGFGCL